MEHQRVVYALPAMNRVTVRKDLIYKTAGDLELKLDVYYPPDQLAGAVRPAVVFVHGDAPQEAVHPVKDWSQYQSWGRLAAASGLVGIPFTHRSSEQFAQAGTVAADIGDLLHYVRTNAAALGVDADRLGLWMCATGTPFGLRAALREPPPWLRCIVAYYGLMDLTHLHGQAPAGALAEYSGVRWVRRSGAPLLAVKAGQDDPALNESIERFAAAAAAAGAPIEVITHPAGRHGFDIVDDTEASRSVIRRTLAFLQEHLLY